jgi:hypothetical protein
MTKHPNDSKRGEENLRVAQYLRLSGIFEGSKAHFFVARAVISIAEDRLSEDTSPPLAALSKKMEEFKREYGLSPDHA